MFCVFTEHALIMEIERNLRGLILINYCQFTMGNKSRSYID